MAPRLTASSIDRLSAIPYYQQLADVLQAQIRSGELKQGARLPSENDLCTAYELSRSTVRQALQLLESRGYATRINGRGVYATEPQVSHGWMIQGTEGFLEDKAGHQNRSVATQVLAAEEIQLPSSACTIFKVATGSRGYQLERLRKLDGVPALYSINYSPEFIIPIIEDASSVLSGEASFSDLLKKAGVTIGGANRTVEAINASGDIAKHLEVAEGAALIHIRSVSWTSDGVRFDIYDTWVRSDVIPLEVSVSAVHLNN